ERTIEVSAHAGTAFDGRYLFQIGENSIRKIDPETGAILATIPAPEGGASGMAWADGSLWVGEYRARKIHQVDPETGKILRTLECGRFVTGVSWVDGELWHATWEDEQADIRHVDPNSGEVLEAIEMPAGTAISGLDADRERFLCGGGSSGKIRVVGRPGR
ncbi:MAG TPA: glutamine cyclotransferase, partial [Devosia sp.]|nr:glutamine cyclotransferase [Devosia sp.]